MDDILNVGLDLGNGRVKVYTNGGVRASRLSFYSAIGEYRTDLGAGSARINILGDNTHRLHCGEGMFLVGDYASDQSRIHFGSMNEYRFSDVTNVKTLMLTGLGLLAKKLSVTEFNVVVGLPLNHFEQKDAVRRIMNGTHSYTLDDTESQMIVHTNQNGIVLCAFGPWADFVLNGNGEVVKSLDRIAFVDFGTGTTDLAQIRGAAENATYIRELAKSIPMGWYTVTNYIAERVAEQGTDLDHFAIDRAIREGRDIGKVKIMPWLAEATEQVGKSVADHMIDLWGKGLDLDAIVVTGGPAGIMAPIISRNYGQEVAVLPDPMYATSRGYFKWGKFVAYA